MTEIYIDSQLIDLYDEEEIVVSFAVNNLFDIESRDGTYSNTFKIPATHTNNKIFGQFNNILSILIETPIPCTKEDSGNKTNLVRMNMFIPEKTSTKTKIRIIKILKEQFNTISIRLKEAKDYVDSCIGEYNMFPKVITKEEVNEIIKKLKPYNVGINIIKLMQ